MKYILGKGSLMPCKQGKSQGKTGQLMALSSATRFCITGEGFAELFCCD
jgi:hypothetical protein